MLYVATRVYYPLLYPLSSAHRKVAVDHAGVLYAIVACHLGSGCFRNNDRLDWNK